MSSAKKRKHAASADGEAAKSGNDGGGGGGSRASGDATRDGDKKGRQKRTPAARARPPSRGGGGGAKPSKTERVAIRPCRSPTPTTSTPSAALLAPPASMPGAVSLSASEATASAHDAPPPKSRGRANRSKTAAATISDEQKSGALGDLDSRNDAPPASSTIPDGPRVEAVATRTERRTTAAPAPLPPPPPTSPDKAAHASAARTGRRKSGAKHKKTGVGAVAAVALVVASRPSVARDPITSSDLPRANARKRKRTATGTDTRQAVAPPPPPPPETADEAHARGRESTVAGAQRPRKIARATAVAVKTPALPPSPFSPTLEPTQQNRRRRKVGRTKRSGSATTSGSEDESKEEREEKEREKEGDDDDDDDGVGWELVEDEGDGEAKSRKDGGGVDSDASNGSEEEEEEEEEDVETDEEEEQVSRVGRGRPRTKKPQPAGGAKRLRAVTAATTATAVTVAAAPGTSTRAPARKKKTTKAATPAPSVLDAAGDAAVERIIALEFAAAARAAVDDDPTRSYDEAYREAVASQTAVNYGLTGNVLLSRMQKYRNKLQQRYAASLVEARLLERVRPGMAQKVVRNAHRMLADRRYAMHPLDDAHYAHPLSPSSRSDPTRDRASPSSLQSLWCPSTESPISLAALLGDDSRQKAADDERDRRRNAAESDEPTTAPQKTCRRATPPPPPPPPTAHVEIGSLPALNKTTGAWGSELFCVRIVARATYCLAPVPAAPENGAAKVDSDGGGGGGGVETGATQRAKPSEGKNGGGGSDDDRETERTDSEDEWSASGSGSGPGSDVTAPVDRLRLVVVLHDRDSGPLGVHHIRVYFTWLAAQHVSRVVFLLERPLTPQAMSEAHRLVASMDWNLECEIFKFSELAFIAVDHDDVPLHETVPPAAVRTLLADVLRVHAQHLPRLKLSTDPIVKYYGNRVGDILRVTSASATNGSRISWCRVVP